MDDILALKSHRERILTDLRNIIKQVYHEAVNHELSPDNVNYITQTLLKRLEEALLFGLKNLQSGYWKIVVKILHPDSLNRLSVLNGFNNSCLSKCRAWICLALLEDAFVSYMNCFVLEKSIKGIYEEWSILRNSDSCNMFLSLLSGIENVSFDYELHDALNWPGRCKLTPRLISVPLPWSPASSFTDSGVQLDKSDDYLNGNLPSVVLRRKAKDTQRHVSFHEDSLAKSPGQRKLKWDVENCRYSWAGEDLEVLKLGCCLLNMQSEKKRARRIHNIYINSEELVKFNAAIETEVQNFRGNRSLFEVTLPDKLASMLGLIGTQTWVYKMWLKVLILTKDRVIILHKDLNKIILKLSQIQQVVVFPHAHEFHILTKKYTHVLRTGDKSVSDEILTRLAYQLHKNRHTVDFRILQPDDITHVKQELIHRRILTEESVVLYLGLVRLQPIEERANDGIFKQGCLMYQTNRCPVWYPAHVILRAGVLYVTGSSKSSFVINLAALCAGCERSSFPDRPHTFTLSLNQPPEFDSIDFYQDFALRNEIKAKSEVIGQWITGMFKQNTQHFVHFAAANEYEMSEWLQTLLAAVCQGNEFKEREPEVSEASLLVTQTNAVLFTQPAQNHCGFRLLASALIQEISSFSVGSHPQDAYCIIELECMEAGSATSDWIIHFGSRDELDHARAVFEQLWTLPQPFPFLLVEDARCERTQDCLAREWFA